MTGHSCWRILPVCVAILVGGPEAWVKAPHSKGVSCLHISSPPKKMQDLPAYSPRGSTSSSRRQDPNLPPSYSVLSLHNFVSPSRRPGSSSSRPSSSRSTSSYRPGLARPTFTIGTKRTPALVTPADLRAHLVLLRAFHALKSDVVYRCRKVDNGPSLGPEKAWRWFLSRAVWRFELWLKNVVTSEASANKSSPDRKWVEPKEIPPIDVCMVWHTYLLVSHRVARSKLV